MIKDLGTKVRKISSFAEQAFDFWSTDQDKDALMMINRLQAYINKHFKGPDILRDQELPASLEELAWQAQYNKKGI